MWCRNVRSQLSAYTDGELSPDLTQQVRAHLVNCERCAREEASLRQLTMLTAAIPLEEVPGSLHQRILASLNQTALTPEPIQLPARRYAAPPRTWAWAAFAVVAIAVAGGAVQYRQGHAPAQSSSLPVKATPASPVVEAPTAARTALAETPEAPQIHPEQPVHHPEEVDTRTTAAREVPEVDQVASTPEVEPVPAPAAPVSTRPAPNRVASVLPPSPAERPQPAPISPSGKLATELRLTEPSSTATSPVLTRDNLMAMPGDPLVNSTGPLGQPEPVIPTEKESTTRMAGVVMETESPGEEDEGLRNFRMFLQENSRSIPQPPSSTPGRERRMRKSL